MLDAPGRDSEPSRENFEKAVVMMAASITEWVSDQKLGKSTANEDDESIRKSQLLLQATDHLRQYGIMGARTAGFVTLVVAGLWAQTQFRIGSLREEDVKSQMSWVMQSPAVQVSIQETFKPLDDEIIIYPGHGAGSACGKNMMKETVDTLKNQKKVNYALNGSCDKEEFVEKLIENLPKPPAYFPANVKLNQDGYDDVEEILIRSNVPISIDEFKNYILDPSIIVLDS